MITIHNEVTIDAGYPGEETVTLWLVSYGGKSEQNVPEHWPILVNALRQFCGLQGWLLEAGDDPYHEKSLALFAEGFSWPQESDNDADDDDESFD